jgi:pimeloyl-ACP methyl ester carboxylesterase
MPLIFLLRSLFSLLSWFLVGLSVYLLWTYFTGIEAVEPDGDIRTIHEDLRLWIGLALAAWSLGGGGLVVRLLLGKSGGRPFKPQRGSGVVLPAANGDRIYIETHGIPTGPTIILTHGWGLDSTIWQYFKEDFADFRLVVWDLPGLGKSIATRPVTLERLAEGLEEVIAWTGTGPFVLVGHSIGGMTIQTLARNRPAALQQARGAVLINTTYTNPLRTMILPGLMKALEGPVLRPAMLVTKALLPLSWLSAWQSYLSGSAHLANRLGFGAYVTKAQLEAATLMATRNSPGVQADGNLAMFDWDATGALAKLNMRLLVLGGSVDIVTKPSASETIAASAPAAALEIAEGAGHLGFVECEERYHAAMRRFIERCFAASVSAEAGNGVIVRAQPTNVEDM